jgi:hypothetical protein
LASQIKKKNLDLERPLDSQNAIPEVDFKEGQDSDQMGISIDETRKEGMG